jgi:galactokinase
VPIGAGLSSSAALEVAVGYALLDMAGHRVDRAALASACQEAEHEFAGTRCGLMDQFIACHGRTGHAVLLDTRSLDARWLPLPSRLAVIVCNTMTSHALATNAYNDRRADCEAGVRVLSALMPGVRALRDVTLEGLEACRGALTEQVFRRCRHVVTENARVLMTADALQSGNLAALGALMKASHDSLRIDFEVSTAELDLMVDLALDTDGVVGARMTGGGFGGCTVNLVDSAATVTFVDRVGRSYDAQTGKRPDIYACVASDGVHRVDA